MAEAMAKDKVDRIIRRIRGVIGLEEFVKVELEDENVIRIKMEVPTDRVNFVNTHSGYLERERKRVVAFTIGIYNNDGIHIIRLWLVKNTLLVDRSIRTRDLTGCSKEMTETGEEWCRDYREDEVGRFKLRVKGMEFHVTANNSPTMPLITAYVWVYLRPG